MMELKYRRAVREDIPSLMEIRKRQLLDEGQVPDTKIDNELLNYFTRQFDHGNLIEWIGEEDGEIKAAAAIAFLEFPPAFSNPSGVKGYITNMYTAPDFRGKGIAAGMLDRLVNEARMRGVSTILLAASRMGAPVYSKYGFQRADEWMELKLC